MKPSEIVQKPVVKVRNPAVDAVSRCRAAGAVRVPQAGGDDEDFAISAHGQQPLDVGDRRRHGNLLYHHELAYDMILFVGLVLGDGRQVPILVGTAEAAVIEAVDHHWRSRPQPAGE